jgi:hypothetical protein
MKFVKDLMTVIYVLLPLTADGAQLKIDAYQEEN